jgi:hypothetical protein
VPQVRGLCQDEGGCGLMRWFSIMLGNSLDLEP